MNERELGTVIRLPTGRSATDDHQPLLVRLARRVESAETIDRFAGPVRTASRALLSTPRRRALLLGSWQGHALHPVLTDLPIGAWTVVWALDLSGWRAARPVAERILAAGLVSAVPTVVTGLAEWGGLRAADQRVGLVHAGGNLAAVGLYGASWHARRRGHHGRGVALGMIGATVATAAGYLGGHLAHARKVSSRHPSFDHDSLR